MKILCLVLVLLPVFGEAVKVANCDPKVAERWKAVPTKIHLKDLENQAFIFVARSEHFLLGVDNAYINFEKLDIKKQIPATLIEIKKGKIEETKVLFSEHDDGTINGVEILGDSSITYTIYGWIENKLIGYYVCRQSQGKGDVVPNLFAVSASKYIHHVTEEQLKPLYKTIDTLNGAPAKMKRFNFK